MVSTGPLQYIELLLYNDMLQVILSNQLYHVIPACSNALISAVVLQEINIVTIVVNVPMALMNITAVSSLSYIMLYFLYVLHACIHAHTHTYTHTHTHRCLRLFIN